MFQDSLAIISWEGEGTEGFRSRWDRLCQVKTWKFYCLVVFIISFAALFSVNDAFVMSAWGNQFNTKGKIRMLADPSAAFTKAVDLSLELAPLGNLHIHIFPSSNYESQFSFSGGTRSKRYSMVIENGVVKTLNVEPDGTGLSCSLADRIKV